MSSSDRDDRAGALVNKMDKIDNSSGEPLEQRIDHLCGGFVEMGRAVTLMLKKDFRQEKTCDQKYGEHAERLAEVELQIATLKVPWNFHKAAAVVISTIAACGTLAGLVAKVIPAQPKKDPAHELYLPPDRKHEPQRDDSANRK